jgi:hypothetical protein
LLATKGTLRSPPKHFKSDQDFEISFTGNSTLVGTRFFVLFAWIPYAYKINCETGGYFLFNYRPKELAQQEKDQHVAMSWNADFPSRLRKFDSGPSWKKWLDKVSLLKKKNFFFFVADGEEYMLACLS